MPFEEDLYTAAERALSRVDALKTMLLGGLFSGVTRTSLQLAQSQEARAACIMYSMAELESLTTSTLQIVNQEINSRAHAIKHCKTSLRALAGHATFESLRDTTDSQRIWQHRKLITSLELSDEIAKLPLSTRAQPPLDGKTLTPKHFDRIWVLYDIEGQWYPNISCRMTLTKMSGVRNDLAHGNIPFSENFSQPGMSEDAVEGYLEDVSELFIHLCHKFADYVLNRSYLL